MWKLVLPKKPTEKTRDLYRFAVEAKPGEPAKLKVEEQRTERQHVALTDIDDGTIQIYQSAKVVSAKVKAALAEVVKRKHELEQVAVNKQQLQGRIDQIGDDQSRIRQNMAQLDRNTDVYKNYVKKFSDQETEIEKLRGQIAALTEREAGLRKALDEYLLGLDLE
jgi:DNA repair exonuclease SbcCD ATPase subunit